MKNQDWITNENFSTPFRLGPTLENLDLEN